MTHRWKMAFFALAGFLIIIIIVAIILVLIMFSSIDAKRENYQPRKAAGETIFTVSTTKDRLNHLVHSQLERLKYNREKIDFTVLLEDKVDVTGYVTVFDRKISFQMLLEPTVTENGDLLLKQDAFYIGELPVPSKQVLKFIASGAELPEWVILEPKAESIYVALNEIEVSRDMKVKAKAVDLENDQILFEIYYAEEK